MTKSPKGCSYKKGRTLSVDAGVAGGLILMTLRFCFRCNDFGDFTHLGLSLMLKSICYQLLYSHKEFCMWFPDDYLKCVC